MECKNNDVKAHGCRTSSALHIGAMLMTDSARDKDEVTKDKKMTIRLKYTIKWRPK